MNGTEMKYIPTWNSLKKHQSPEWLDDAKYGIYFHWGIYSVPACGKNGSWYPHLIYASKFTKQHRYHKKNYGPLTEFGYKDFIPMFTAEEFDANEWAQLFKEVGAKFAGPVAIHHDGFCMWNSKVSKWNSYEMGPKRDILGEMEKAIKAEGMKFFVAFHHAANWWFFPHWKKKYDTSHPENSGLYGPIHNENSKLPYIAWNKQDKPSVEFLDDWKEKIIEVIDLYKPDLIWHDFALGYLPDLYKKEVLCYYYNKALEWGKEVEFLYKQHNLPPGVGVLDYERGRSKHLTYHKWISDTTVDSTSAWSYVKDAKYKTVRELIHIFVDIISKNGYIALNFGPRADGVIPEPALKCLKGLGQWLNINGEAIYNSTPWLICGEGPTKTYFSGSFSELQKAKFGSKDIRFVAKDNCIYAISLGWPKNELTIKVIRNSFRKVKKFIGTFGVFKMRDYAIMDESDIQSINLLGNDQDLEWKLTEKGLKIKVPETPPCDHAFTFKIIRRDYA